MCRYFLQCPRKTLGLCYCDWPMAATRGYDFTIFRDRNRPSDMRMSGEIEAVDRVSVVVSQP